MPFSAPTYSAAYDQTEQNTNAGLIATAINANATGDTALKAALLAWVTTVQNAVEASLKNHNEPGPSLYLIRNAFTTLAAALS